MTNTYLHLVGARPNFVKVAPLLNLLSKDKKTDQKLIHSGQHYNDNMSKIFFEELSIKEPERNMNIGSGTHTFQTAMTMLKFEEIVQEIKPNLLILYGDVNATIAGALVGSKMGIPIAHVEAGLRSYDKTMPEEINRILTDQVSSILFTPSRDANANLLKENHLKKNVHFVGNIMIDTLISSLKKARSRWKSTQINNFPKKYGLVTLHRPSNVDNPETLSKILGSLVEISKSIPLVFPMHPRTFESIKSLNVNYLKEKLLIIEPQGYIDFLSLEDHSEFVITDSGGVQEETTFLGIPCLTMRPNTERPVTVNVGTNVMVGNDLDKLHEEIAKISRGDAKTHKIPELWDGQTAHRIAKVLKNRFAQ